MRFKKPPSQQFRRRSLSLLVTALVAGCGGNSGNGPGANPCLPPSETPANFIVILFDVSGSTGTDAARSRYREGLQTVLDAFGKDGAFHGKESTVAVGAIDANTQTSFDPRQCNYPEMESGANPLVHASKVNKAQKGLNEKASEIIDGPRTQSGSAIIDAVSAVSRLFYRHADAEGKYLVIFSDMVEESGRGKGLTEADCPALSRATDAKLDDVQGYVAGAGVSTKPIPPERVDEVRKFWTCYFKELGGELSTSNYGPTLLGFP
jgi:hypothetical protein